MIEGPKVVAEGACSFCGSTEGDCCEAWDAKQEEANN